MHFLFSLACFVLAIFLIWLVSLIVLTALAYVFILCQFALDQAIAFIRHRRHKRLP